MEPTETISLGSILNPLLSHLQGTTGMNFQRIPIALIDVVERQRQRTFDYDHVALCDSIKTYGLLQPIVVDKIDSRFRLIAGGRRLEACRALGWETIPANLLSELSFRDKEVLEYIENAVRVDLAWPDRMTAICKITDLCGNDYQVASLHIGISDKMVQNYIRVKAACDENPALTKLPKFTEVLALVEKVNRRALSDIENSLDELMLDEEEAPAPTPTSTIDTIVSELTHQKSPDTPSLFNVTQADFKTFAENYSGPKFSFIHCDFPYGINFTDSKQYGRRDNWDADVENYDDSPENYWELVDALLSNHEKLVSPNAFLMFWFSMNLYSDTLQALTSKWRVQPFPLIWGKSDSRGIIPDARRGPRRCYETAFLATVGDVQVISAVSNICWHPTTKVHHVSEKPVPVLQHFFRMICNEQTRLLDPTCGSGTALEAAASFGATTTGVELNPEHAAYASKRAFV